MAKFSRFFRLPSPGFICGEGKTFVAKRTQSCSPKRGCSFCAEIMRQQYSNQAPTIFRIKKKGDQVASGPWMNPGGGSHLCLGEHKMQFGYIRVSTRDQNLDRQIIAMEQVDIPITNLFIDRQSGKDFQRPEYQKMINAMKKDDLLYIKSIDRLGRNYEEILEQWRVLTKVKGVDIVVLDMPLLDTRRGKDLMGTFLSDIVLQVLSFVAENERVYIRQRQKEGIAAAKAKGIRFGRPTKPLPPNFYLAYCSWKSGEISSRVAANICNMPHSTFYHKAMHMDSAY